MKKLELNQMEILNGGTNGRNCMILGGLSVVSLAIPGGGIVAALSIFALASSQDCF